MKSIQLFLFAIIAVSSVLSGDRIKVGEPWKRTTIYFAVDDKINKIYLNDNLVPVDFGVIGNNVWATVKYFDLALFPGDEIRFELENFEGVHELDSFGFVASIFYVDQHGKEKTFVTNADWECDGKKPQLMKKLKDERGVSKITWTHDIHLNKEGSYIIWGKDSGKTTSCSFTIPKLK